MRENGEQALIEARRLQEQLAEQSQNIHSHWAELREKETRIATVSFCEHFTIEEPQLYTIFIGIVVTSPPKEGTPSTKTRLKINNSA